MKLFSRSLPQEQAPPDTQPIFSKAVRAGVITEDAAKAASIAVTAALAAPEPTLEQLKNQRRAQVDSLSRASMVIGRILEDLGDQHSRLKAPVAFIYRVLGALWLVVDVALERSLFSLLTKRWLNLIMVLGLTLIAFSVLFQEEALQKPGWLLFCLALLAYLAAAMVRSWWAEARIAHDEAERKEREAEARRLSTLAPGAVRARKPRGNVDTIGWVAAPLILIAAWNSAAFSTALDRRPMHIQFTVETGLIVVAFLALAGCYIFNELGLVRKQWRLLSYPFGLVFALTVLWGMCYASFHSIENPADRGGPTWLKYSYRDLDEFGKWMLEKAGHGKVKPPDTAAPQPAR